eukprot:gene10955-3027_t
MEYNSKAEAEHFYRVQRALKFYGTHAFSRITRAVGSFQKLPASHQSLLPEFRSDMKMFKEPILTNLRFVNHIASSADFIETEGYNLSHIDEETPSEANMEKVYTTIKQFYRDWSTEGRNERDMSYGRVLSTIQTLFKDCENSTNMRGKIYSQDISILTPGTGLGRLTWELAKLGYNSQGNEWSAFMLLGSNYILNTYGIPEILLRVVHDNGHIFIRCIFMLFTRPGDAHRITIYPFAHLYCNNISRSNQLLPVSIPDVDTHSLPHDSNLSMTAGDFLEVYHEPDAWDCIASCFFLDTAANPIAILERIYQILKPGGYVVNFGPLLYHFEDNCEQPSLELPFDNILRVALRIGFHIVDDVRDIQATYNNDPSSMMSTVYKCCLLVLQKPPGTKAPSQPSVEQKRNSST